MTARIVTYAAMGLGLAAVALSTAGCGSASRAFGKSTPDEFRVVARAPLVVPPDYALRPPAPGEPRPQELQPESQARLALLGRQQAADRSVGENALVAKAGVSKADPLIRYVVDDEQGSLAHKDKSFADTVMFWRKPSLTPVQQAAQTNAVVQAPAAVDAAAEEAAVRALTGGNTVVIARQPEKTARKLPGL
jgi:hypothetical protein